MRKNSEELLKKRTMACVKQNKKQTIAYETKFKMNNSVWNEMKNKQVVDNLPYTWSCTRFTFQMFCSSIYIVNTLLFYY